MAMGSRDNNDRGTMSQINVTPLVDVMLVLLVIFMVTAPMMQQGMEVNLPKVEAKGLEAKDVAVVVSIDRESRLYLNDESVPRSDLGRRLSEVLSGKSKKEVLLKADQDVPYGEVVRTMAQIKGAGVERLGMVTEPIQKK